MGFHPADFGLPMPFRSRVRSRHATDRQTDGQTDTVHNSIMPLPYGGRGHKMAHFIAMMGRPIYCVS